MVKNGTLYYVHTDNLGSIQAITDENKNIVSSYYYTPWGGRVLLSGANITDRGYTFHEHLEPFGLINMNGRVCDPVLARFLSPDNYVQAPDFTQSFNRYSYCLNNPFKYTDPDGEFWHIIVGALIGGVVNLIANWNNCEGFWQYVAAFGAGAATAATGGAAGATWVGIAGVSAAGSAAIMGTNSVIAQTGHNFSGMGNVDWGQVGISSAIGCVSGFAGGAAGYWAANSSMLTNGINSPILRSAVVSPLAAGAGHIAGRTTANLFAGQNLSDAFANSFNGLGSSMIVGGAMGVASTVAVNYANNVNPWTGKNLTQATPKTISIYRAVSTDEYKNINSNGLRPNPDGSGYQEGKLFYKSYQDAVNNTSAYDAAFGQKSIIIKIDVPYNISQNFNYFHMDGYDVIYISTVDLPSVNNVMTINKP